MRLLITRPEPDASDLARHLNGLGHETLVAPMMEVRFIKAELPDLSTCQALVFTSANGVRAFAHMSEDRSLPALCVGDATATAAGESGFGTVRSAGGDVEDLAGLIAKEHEPEAGALLHIAGSVVARDLGHLLTDRGFQVERVALYEVTQMGELPAEVLAALKAAEFDGVLFYSPRTAQTFRGLVETSNLEGVCQRLHAFCLSSAVAAELTSLSFGSLDIAANPTQDALLKLLP